MVASAPLLLRAAVRLLARAQMYAQQLQPMKEGGALAPRRLAAGGGVDPAAFVPGCANGKLTRQPVRRSPELGRVRGGGMQPNVL